MDNQTRSTDQDKGNGVELTTEQARAGATPHMTRYVLGWSLVLVIIAFAVVVGFGQLST